jgi:hypothetical protein
LGDWQPGFLLAILVLSLIGAHCPLRREPVSDRGSGDAACLRSGAAISTASRPGILPAQRRRLRHTEAGRLVIGENTNHLVRGVKRASGFSTNETMFLQRPDR